jgi:hypothetical protein
LDKFVLDWGGDGYYDSVPFANLMPASVALYTGEITAFYEIFALFVNLAQGLRDSGG